MEKINHNGMRDLIEMTGKITNKHDETDFITGKKFNIFEVANINTDERTICRVLRELLNPKGSHGQGGIYLEIFLKECLHMDFDKTEVNTAEVRREDGAYERPIDITIRINNYFIPIEVKINADDGENQCYDYFIYAKGLNAGTIRETKIVYLSKYGDYPSEKSSKKSNEEKLDTTDVICISWKDDIIFWLKRCLEESGTSNKVSICEILNQLVTTIKHFTNQLEDDFMTEITELLRTPKDMQNADNITTASSNRKADMTIRLFDSIEKNVGREVVTFGNRDNDIRKYYTTNQNQWAKIQFLFRKIKPDTNIFFVIELFNEDLVAGLLISGNKEHKNWSQWALSDEESKRFGLYQRNGHWSNKFQQPFLKSNRVIFRYHRDHNETFYNLFDNEFFNEYVHICVAEVEHLWAKWEREINECEDEYERSKENISDK